jgi:Protein kinase domain
MAGRGGMGEVYRAEDLRLSQTVALKFLPESVAQDGAALARFHREVRIAREVSHPNVCRVFDIGDVDGLPFLTMEYVDGEDLATLLRRIGRLPSDKAIEVARQICAGLAAAHEHGVIHRDLKPANVMIDGRGKVRITDFGLAGAAGSFHEEESLAGTPAYMAPEQFEGKEASVRSDIYALGLVLYEVFTGKRAFEAATLADLQRAHKQSSPKNPSQLVKDIDPRAEEVILRCLAKDPAARPASVLQVAAAFAGGDPLAAALAAGETPSPEMVAASGEAEGLRPAVAWLLLAGVILSVTAAILLGAQSMLFRRVPLEKPPEALAERAREILQSVHYAAPPADTAVGFYHSPRFLEYVAEHDKSNTRWDRLETGAFVFWYRSSPRPLSARQFLSEGPSLGSIWIEDPPLTLSGMTLVLLNPRGRLTKMVAVPPQIEQAESAAPAPDWGPLFAAAGLDPSEWTPAVPSWTPPVYSDTRAAWTGSLAERPEIPMRVETAAYHGKPVYFELVGPWTRPDRVQPEQESFAERAILALIIAVLLAVVVGSAMLARRNLLLGRSDRRGAFRLALFSFAAFGVSWLFGAHHVPDFDELMLFVLFLFWAIGLAFLNWVVYIALEPYVRRRWPATLVSWSRLLVGSFRDPAVGRDILIGCLLGAFGVALRSLAWIAPSWLGYLPRPPMSAPELQLLGARAMISDISVSLGTTFFVPFIFLIILIVFRALLRKEWLAAFAFVLLFALFNSEGWQTSPLVWIVLLTVWGLTVFAMIRFGVLAIMVQGIFQNILWAYPLTTQASAWYAGIGLAAILLMAAVAFYGFYASLGGRPAFGGAVLQE